MIKKNTYKAKKKNILLFLVLLTFAIILILSKINFRFIVKSELEAVQKHFVTFSSFKQLFDSGHVGKFTDIESKDIFPASYQFFKVIKNGLIKNKNTDLENISLFIKFKNLNKIYEDRKKL